MLLLITYNVSVAVSWLIEILPRVISVTSSRKYIYFFLVLSKAHHHFLVSSCQRSGQQLIKKN